MPNALQLQLQTCLRLVRYLGDRASVTSLALLAGCTSVPLPPWPNTQASAPVSDLARPPQQAPALPAGAGPTPPAAAEALPMPAATLPETAPPVVSRSEPPAAPYSAAVAARFPSPAVIYRTPGLDEGRTTFSTQAEIRAWLVEQSAQAQRSAGMAAELLTTGRSQQGQALLALILVRGAATDPAALESSGKPTVLLIGQQHGDEPASGEALLVMARELAQGRLQPLLERINVIIVPQANPDGAASGRRAVSNGLDLNRDHLLLNTPEAQSLARLTRDYRPTVVVDAHEYEVLGRYQETLGGVQKFDALLQYATTANLPEFLTKASEEWYRRPMLDALRVQGLSADWYHTLPEGTVGRKIAMGSVTPDNLRNVDGLKNTISLLVETRGLGIGRLHIQRRVHTHVTAMTSVLASTVQRAAELRQLRPYIDKEVAAAACRESAVVQALPTSAQHELLMLDPVTGLDRTITVEWDSALALRTVKARARPCGYLLSGDSTTAVDRLRLHGVQVQRVMEAGSLLADSYREASRTRGVSAGLRGAGGRPIVQLEVSLARAVVDVAVGSYYVPLNQPMANLALAALEPDTPDSYFAHQLIADPGSVARVMTPPNLKLEDLP